MILKQFCKKILVLPIALVVSMVFSLEAQANPQGLLWLDASLNPDGSYALDSDISTPEQSTDEVINVINLLSTNSDINPPITYINENTYNNSEYLSRKIIANQVTGNTVNLLVNELVLMQNYDGGFGELTGYDSTSLDTSFALKALSKVGFTDTDVIESAISYLIRKQLTDGGFPVKLPNESAVYVTANVSMALQNYMLDYDLGAVIAGANNFILAQQNLGGSWDSDWETAIALLAIIPATTDASLYTRSVNSLRSNQLADGSWNSDVYETALSVQALFVADGVAVPSDPVFGTLPIYGALNGRVNDANTGLPLNNVLISFQQNPLISAVTKADGSFSLTNIEPGLYTIDYQRDGYQGASAQIQVVAGQLLDLGQSDLVPVQTTGIITGVITDSSTGNAIPGAIINITGSVSLLAQTGSDGFYSIALPPGTVSITVSANGYDELSATGTVVAGSAINFSPSLYLINTAPTDPVLNQFVVIKGVVVDADTSQGLIGAGILINGVSMVLTDDTGNFQIDGVVAGELNIEVSLLGYQSATTSTIAPKGSVINLGIIHLPKIPVPTTTTTTVVGTVVDDVTNTAIAGAIVSVVGIANSVATDANGMYEIPNINGTQFNISAGATGYISKSATVDIAQVGIVKVDFKMKRAIVSNVDITNIHTHQPSFDALTEVEADVILENTGTVDKHVRLYIKVLNSQNKIVDEFSPKTLTVNTIITDDIFTVPVNNPVEVEVEWNTNRHNPGMYKIIVQAFDADTSAMLSQRDVQFEILTTQKIGGIGQFNPPLTQLVSKKPIQIVANVSNKGNLPITATTLTANVSLKNEGYKIRNNLVNISSYVKDQGLDNPRGMDVDTLGNTYVANYNSGTVSKITSDGLISEFAVGFNRPVDIDIRSNGDIYILNEGAKFVRIEQDGTRNEVSTGLAPQRGFEALADGRVLIVVGKNLYEVTVDGVVNKLIGGGLLRPKGMVTDSQGAIFIANSGENGITKFYNGALTTFVSNINQPYGIAIDEQDNLYVTSYSDNSLIKITPTGTQSVIASGLSGPYDVKISPQGDFVVSNQTSSEIVSISPQGIITTLVSATIYSPKVVKYNSTDDLLVANESSRNIVKLSPSMNPNIVVTGVNAVDFISEDNGDISILESRAIKRADSTGKLTTIVTGLRVATDFVKANDGNGFLVTEIGDKITRVDSTGALSNYMTRQINRPRAMRSVNNDMYIAYINGIIKVGEAGDYSHVATGLNNIYGLAIDASNNIYVSEFNKNQILKIDATGNITVFATTTFKPGALALTEQGQLLVAPWGGTDIYLVDSVSQAVYTSFAYPVYYDMLMDNSGALWATHLNNQRVSKLSSDGTLVSYTINRTSPKSLSSDGNGGAYIGSQSGLEYIDANGTLVEIIGSSEIGSKNIFGARVDSNGGYWLLDVNSLLTRFSSDLSVDIVYTPLINPKSMSYENNGSLIVVNGNDTIVKISAQNQMPEVIAYGSYNKIFMEPSGTAMLTNSSSVKRLNINTGTISDVVNSSLGLESIAIKSDGAYVISNTSRNELLFYSATDSFVGNHVGLVSPKGLLFDSTGKLLISNKFPNNISTINANGSLEMFSDTSNVEYMLLSASNNVRASSGSSIFELDTNGMKTNTYKAERVFGLTNTLSGELVSVSFAGNVYQYLPDGSSTKIASGLVGPNDIESDSQGNIYIADNVANDVKQVNPDNSLSLIVDNVPVADKIISSDEGDIFVKYDKSKLMSLSADGVRTEYPIGVNIVKNIAGIAKNGSEIYASLNVDNEIKKLVLDLLVPATNPGQIVYSSTIPISELNLDSPAVALDFGKWTPEESGDYLLEISANDGVTTGQLINSLHVGPSANGVIGLEKSIVFPGDRAVSGYINVFGADSTSVTNVNADGAILAASSGANGRGLVADTKGNIFVSDGGGIVKVTPDAQVSTFLTGVVIRSELAIDSNDNIYFLDRAKVMKVTSDAQVSLVTTLPTFGMALAVNYSDELYVVDLSNNLSRIQDDGSIDVITTLQVRPLMLTIDAYDYFYVYSGSFIDGSIIKISPDGKTTSVVLENTGFEGEGEVMAADCSNNLLIAPFKMPPYKNDIGEEDIIIQVVGDTGETRQVFYGPDVDPALMDMDVLYYDKFGKRLLIYSDLNRGKIFSFPIVCGGIDTEAHIVTRADVDLSSADPAPTNIVDRVDGTKEYVWFLPATGDRGESIRLNMLFKGLSENETRPAVEDAFLVFNNSFDLGNPVSIPMAIPTLLARTAVDLTPSLNATQYGPNKDVNISVGLTNNADQAFSGTLELSIVDLSGASVAQLPVIVVNGLSASSSLDYSSKWNTALTYIGDYKLQAKLINDVGVEVAAGAISFMINAFDNQSSSVINSNISTDKPLYEAWDSVLVNARVRNIATNVIQLPVQVELSVTSPDSVVIYKTTVEVRELYPNSYQDIIKQLNLVNAKAGQYTIIMSTTDGLTGVQLSTNSVRFNVISDQVQAINGTMSASPRLVTSGEAVICESEITNISDLQIDNIQVTQSTANMADGSFINQQQAIVSIAQNASTTNIRTINTSGLIQGEYACLLSATVDQKAKQLAAAGFQVSAPTVPPIKIGTQILTTGVGRLLVLMDEERKEEDEEHHDEGNHKEGDDHYSESHNEEDAHNSEKLVAESSASEQRAFIEAYLNSQPWPYTIVTNSSDFTNELYRGGYSLVAMFSEHVKLNKLSQQILREAVYSGTGLLVAGQHDERNKHIDDALGIKYLGKENHLGLITLLDSPIQLIGEQVLSYADKINRTQLKGAEIAGLYLSDQTSEDAHDKDHFDDEKEDDDHDKDDNEDDHTASNASVTYYQYGIGYSVYVSFDLLAQATALGDVGILDDLIQKSLNYVHPDNVPHKAGQVIPVSIQVTNEGMPVDGRVLVNVPQHVLIVNAGNGQLEQNNTVSMEYSLQENATAQLTLWIKLPDTTETLQISTLTQTGKSPDWIDTNSQQLIINLENSVSLDEVIEKLTALPGEQDKYLSKALKHLNEAQSNLSENKLEKALHYMLEAAEDLEESSNAQASEIRLVLDLVIAVQVTQLTAVSDDD